MTRFAEIAVEDDGPGIPEARREEAFRPFHRLDEGRNLQTRRLGAGPGHRPRHRPRAWRGYRAGQKRAGRIEGGDPAAGLSHRHGPQVRAIHDLEP